MRLGKVRQTVEADNDETFYTQKNVPWEIKGEYLLTEGTDDSWTDDVGAGNLSVTFEADTGQKWVGSGGWLADTPEFKGGSSGGDAAFHIKFSPKDMAAA